MGHLSSTQFGHNFWCVCGHLHLLTLAVIFRAMPHQPLSHDEVLDKICGVCYRKGPALKLRGISANVLKVIQKDHWAGYNVESGEYPRKVCLSCNSTLLNIAKVGLEASKV